MQIIIECDLATQRVQGVASDTPDIPDIPIEIVSFWLFKAQVALATQPVAPTSPVIQASPSDVPSAAVMRRLSGGLKA